MRVTRQLFRLVPARLAAGGVLALAVLAGPVWLAADLAAQAPPKKAKEEVEEPAPKPTPGKAPLRVEDDEAPAAKPAKSAIPRLEELVRDAKDESPAVRKLYESLVPPYDLVHWKAGSLGRTMKVEPFPARIADEKAKYAGKAKLRRLPEGDGRAIEMDTSDVKFIEPYELVAVRQVSDFLAAHKEPKTLSVDYLQAAERALAAVESYHESARQQGVRQGDEWKDVSEQVRRKLRDVQKQQLELYSEKNDWKAAFAAASRLAESNPRPEVQKQFVAALAKFVLDLLKKDEDLVEAQRRVAAIKSLFPASDLDEQTDSDFRRKADELIQQADVLMKDKPGEADKKLQAARLIYPRHSKLRLKAQILNNNYSILKVGVRQLPAKFAPGVAATDTEQLCLDLLFESLVKPVYDSRIGQRYYPVLAADYPKLVTLGREFELVRDAFWSDGKPVTGVDVRETLEKLLRDQRGGNAGGGDGLQPLKGARIAGGDPFHVAVSLRRGFLDPLALMAFKVLPYRPELKLDEFARQPICSGPYELKYRRDDEVAFQANGYYRRAARPGLPNFSEIRLYPATEPSAFTRDANPVQLMLDIPTRELNRFDSLRQVHYYTLRPRRVYFLAVNHRKPALQKLDVRRALGLAIDREEILNGVFRPQEGSNKKEFHRALNGPFPPESWAYNRDFKPHADPVAVAKSLVLKEQTALKGTRLSLKYPDDDPRVKLACEQIAKQVQAVAEVQLDLLPLPPAQLRQDVEQEHRYELAYYHLDYADENYTLWPLFDDQATRPGGSNYLGYTDADLLTKFQSALDHRDFREVRKFIHDVHKQIYEKMPLIPLWQLDVHVAVHDDLQTAPQDPPHLDPLRLFSDVEQWHFRKR